MYKIGSDERNFRSVADNGSGDEWDNVSTASSNGSDTAQESMPMGESASSSVGKRASEGGLAASSAISLNDRSMASSMRSERCAESAHDDIWGGGVVKNEMRNKYCTRERVSLLCVFFSTCDDIRDFLSQQLWKGATVRLTFSKGPLLVLSCVVVTVRLTVVTVSRNRKAHH